MNIRIPVNYNVTEHFLEKNMREGRASKIAIYFKDESLTYHALSEKVNKVGNAMQAGGIKAGSKVLMILYDTPHLVASYYGALKIGAVPISVSTWLTTEDYRYFLEDSCADLLLVEKDLLPIVLPAAQNMRFPKPVVVVGEAEGFISFENWVEASSTKLDCAKTNRDDVAFFQYSSGTSGKPKGTVHLHYDMHVCYEGFAKQVLGISGDDVILTASKLFFGYGMGNGMFFPFRAGASTVLMQERPTPEHLLHAITKYRPTVFFAVPTIYAAMLREAEKKDYDVSSIRLFVSAGEALPPSLYHKWKKRFGVEIVNGIGSTETLHVFIANRPGFSKPGSVGKVVPGYEVKIVDDDLREVMTGEVGNLLVKGDSLAPSYWNKQETMNQKMIGEWFFSGDKFYQDADGYYWYCGRSDDMLKVGGIWVSPVEIENCLLEHPAVTEACVIGEKDKDELVKTGAYVVLANPEEASDALAKELQSYVKARLGSIKYPRAIHFRKELPKTASGKIHRNKLE
ncbi:benzoate-CoA ligase family protein [Brevibacillus sp. NRS-1366]|uniref:benzoate-CoA ligase family protein n=1 Tax=Brevibacillus sp. NRS-1366 TaxID=3233899 RepID=UPI003D213E6A